jgi:hypothetical protein
MCGAYGFSVNNAKEVYDRFEIENILEGLKPRWNVRPEQMNPIVTSQSPNQISRMFWGLFCILQWTKIINIKPSTRKQKQFRHDSNSLNYGLSSLVASRYSTICDKPSVDYYSLEDLCLFLRHKPHREGVYAMMSVGCSETFSDK